MLPLLRRATHAYAMPPLRYFADYCYDAADAIDAASAAAFTLLMLMPPCAATARHAELRRRLLHPAIFRCLR